ncbi:MAG: hypothetical protein ACJAUW_001501 [Yoonia sp.]|jgi:hypothetical protein
MSCYIYIFWLRELDLNQRPSGYEAQRCSASPKRCIQGVWHLTHIAGLEVDVVDLKNAADVGFVGRISAEFLDRGGLVAEGFKEGEWELSRIKGLFGEIGDGLFNFDCVQMPKSMKYTSSRRRKNACSG